MSSKPKVDVDVEELRKQKAQLEKKVGARLMNPLLVGGEVVFFRAVPTADSYKHWQVNAIKSASSTSRGATDDASAASENLVAIENYVIRNVAHPSRERAKELLDEAPWIYSRVFTELNRATEDTEQGFIDLGK